MIIGGLQTGNTRWLAAHLQNAADNESIELAEVTGTIARDVDGALVEFDAYTAGTRATEGVYACFINPPEPLTRLQYAKALAHIEKRLGLTGQPRIVVFHVKNGREHCHVVWSRIDTKAMKAIQLSHDRQKLRRCARELAAAFSLELPPNLANDRGAARFDEPPQPTRAEKAMEATSGLSREERRRLITDCYRNSDSAEAFANALEAAGFMLARGDKRCFVIVDIAGHVHSLARQIDGAKTKDVKKKLEGLTLSLLPPVEKAKVLMLQRAAAQQDAVRDSAKKSAETDKARERLVVIQRKRRTTLDLLWQQMKIRQMHEWKVLLAHIKAEKEYRIARRHFRAVGLALYLRKIAVIRQLIEYYLKRRKRRMEERHRLLMEGLRRRHDNEAAELRRRYCALERLERRETFTFGQKFGEPFATDDSATAGAVRMTWRAHYKLATTTMPIARAPISVRAAEGSVNFRVNGHDLGIAATPVYERPVFIMSQPRRMDSTGFGMSWTTAFHENAADITDPVVNFRFVTDDETARENPGGHGEQPAYPSSPGAG
jgi:hypothetical protein